MSNCNFVNLKVIILIIKFNKIILIAAIEISTGVIVHVFAIDMRLNANADYVCN